MLSHIQSLSFFFSSSKNSVTDATLRRASNSLNKFGKSAGGVCQFQDLNRPLASLSTDSPFRARRRDVAFGWEKPAQMKLASARGNRSGRTGALGRILKKDKEKNQRKFVRDVESQANSLPRSE